MCYPALRFGTIRRLLPLSLLVALAIAGCGGEAAPTREWTNEESADSPRPAEESVEPSGPPAKSAESPPPDEGSAQPPERPAKAPTAAEVATYLDRELDLSRRQAGDKRPEQIRVRVYASRQQLREEQRFLDEALGGFQPVAVKCGVVRVEVTVDEVPAAQTIEEDAQELKRTLSARYRC
jgi:hypothetical protein